MGTSRSGTTAQYYAPPKAQPHARIALPVCDPITMEPLCELSVPPFELHLQNDQQSGTATAAGSVIRAGRGDASGAANSLFDGEVLSLYLVSQARFVHPLSGRPLGRGDVKSLDAHIAKYRLEVSTSVTEMFDCQQRVQVEGAVAGAHGRGAALQQQATTVLHALFGSRSQPRQPRPRPMSSTPPSPRRSLALA